MRQVVGVDRQLVAVEAETVDGTSLPPCVGRPSGWAAWLRRAGGALPARSMSTDSPIAGRRVVLQVEGRDFGRFRGGIVSGRETDRVGRRSSSRGEGGVCAEGGAGIEGFIGGGGRHVPRSHAPEDRSPDEFYLAPREQKGRLQVRRERADRMIVALAEEAARINQDPLPWYDVTRLSVFGSYLSSKVVLGDLDIAVRVTPRWERGGDGFARAWGTFPDVCPPPARMRDQLDLIHWPRMYVFARLKRMGRGLSLHGQEDLDSCGFEHCVFFETSEDGLLFRM